MYSIVLFSSGTTRIHMHQVTWSNELCWRRQAERPFPHFVFPFLCQSSKVWPFSACSLSLDARQANTGPGIRRERGGITAERFTAKTMEAAVWQSQHADWHSRVLKLGHLQSLSPWEGGRFSVLALASPAVHCLLLSLFLAVAFLRQASCCGMPG